VYVRRLIAGIPLMLLGACSRTAPRVAEAASPPTKAETAAPGKREIRLTGLVEAVHSSKILVPQIFGPGGAMTLTHLIPSGAMVKEGDLIATFDATTQIDQARDAQAKYDDLTHQVEQKQAQNAADAAKRAADFKQAEGDLSKAELELKKGPTLAEIDRLKDEDRLNIARKHVASLRKSNAAHDRSDAAALRILELQRDRQKVMLERTQTNISKLEIHSTLPGMVAIQNVFRANSQGKPQEGDQLWPRQVLASIFDPHEMAVRCTVGEPDGVALTANAGATVYLDAYPDIALPGHVEFVSPVASSALGSPIKNFTALIRLDRTDPRIMPDLSAAVVVKGEGK
jgi:multidrug efflux pump subunit AcrA (membrane-fusion protein)